MIRNYKYSTVSEAVTALREKKFDKNFYLNGEYLECNGERFEASDLKIAIVYRYEGASDPGDEASVYGLESKSGLKGILVTADGTYSNAASAQILKKLHTAKNKSMQNEHMSSIH